MVELKLKKGESTSKQLPRTKKQTRRCIIIEHGRLAAACCHRHQAAGKPKSGRCCDERGTRKDIYCIPQQQRRTRARLLRRRRIRCFSWPRGGAGVRRRIGTGRALGCRGDRQRTIMIASVLSSNRENSQQRLRADHYLDTGKAKKAERGRRGFAPSERGGIDDSRLAQAARFSYV